MSLTPDFTPCALTVAGEALEMRAMTPDDSVKVIALMRIEKWMQSDDEIRGSNICHPGTNIGVFSKSGHLISCCICVPCGDNYSFVGEFVTVENYRGKGIGSKLFAKVSDTLARRSSYLLANWEVVPFYERMGYLKTGEVVYDLTLGFTVPDNPPAGNTSVTLKEIDESNIDGFLQYERSLCTIDRSEYSKICMIKNRGVVYKFAAYQDSKMVGTICLCNHEYDEKAKRCCVFYAESPDIAKLLFYMALKSQPCDTKYEFYITSNNLVNMGDVFIQFGVDLNQSVKDYNEPYVMCCKGDFEKGIVSYDKVYAMASHSIHMF